MSNTSINIIYILGTKISLESLSKNLKKGSLPLDGLKVSKEWKQAKIEDPNFEFFFEYDEFVKIYSKSPEEVESERTTCGLLKIYRFSIPFLIRKKVRVFLNLINGMDKDNYHFNTNLFYKYLNKNSIKYNKAEFNLIIKILKK